MAGRKSDFTLTKLDDLCLLQRARSSYQSAYSEFGGRYLCRIIEIAGDRYRSDSLWIFIDGRVR